jgi:Na+/glutamate symporter
MTDWTSIAQGAANVATLLAPLVGAAFPGASIAIEMGTKIIQGVIAGEPTAIALYNRIKNGEVPTPAELQQFSDDYEASYQRLKRDIAAKLAALPPE